MPAQPMTRADLAPVVVVSGRPLAADLVDTLLSARIDRGLGLVGRATLRFVDQGFRLSSTGTFVLGAAVKISQHDSTIPLFQGEVTSVNLEQAFGRPPELIVTADDAAIKLTRDTRNETYLQATYSDVVTKIAGRNGLSSDVASTTDRFEYQLQAGTDLSYLNALAARTGMVWWVDDRKLVFKPAALDAAPTARLRLGEDLLSFSVKASGLTPDSVKVTGWDRKTKQGIVATAKPHGPVESTFVKGARKRTGAPGAIIVADRHPRTQSEATQLAGALVGEASAGAVVARGTCLIDSRVVPGSPVAVENAGPASGTYFVSSVEHVFNTNGFVSSFVTGVQRPSGLVDLMASAEPSPGLTVPGVMVAVVTAVGNTSGNSVYDAMVKVKFPGVSDTIESDWARVATMGGGASRGSVFLPEVNDEVLVAFEGGDTSRPVVLGGLFGGRDGLPPGAAFFEMGKVNYRRITSRLGHVIELADGTEPTKQHVLIELSGGGRIRLGKDRLDLEIQGKPITITNGAATVGFTDKGDVSIEGVNITLKASKDVTIQGLNVNVKATVGAKVEGVTVDVKGSATTSVQATGQLALKGAMVAIN